MSTRWTALVLAAGALPLLAACGGSAPDSTPAAAPSVLESDDHGEIAGAVELDEAPVALTTVDADGAVRHLDLLDESVTELPAVPPATALHTDGRYLYTQGADGVSVLDSGVWTWDHVDHFHYYRSEPRWVGTVDGEGPATVATTLSSTSGGVGLFFAESGEAVVLDVEAIAEGELAERSRTTTEPHDGMVVPVGEHALLTEPGARGVAASVVVLDAAGERVPGSEVACPTARGTITTRVGAVVGCADGALLAEPVGDELEVVRIPYPEGATAPRATSFAARDGRPTVAGLAGPDAVWLLDTRERSWRLLEAPEPLVGVTAVDDDDEHVVALTAQGEVLVMDGVTGRPLATTAPLAARSLRSGTGQPTLVVDQQRAYLSAPAERRLHEIDFVDGARIARSFDAPTAPLLVAGTGR